MYQEANIAVGSWAEFALGEQTIIIAVDNRAAFRPAPFVSLTRTGNVVDYAIARPVSYDPADGTLVVNVIARQGSVGPHQDVLVTGTPGGVVAQIAYLAQAQAAAAGAAESALQTAEDRENTGAARDAVASLAEDVAAAVTTTDQNAAAAQEAADRAQTFNPMNYQARSEKGQPNGYVGLDSAGKVPAENLPESSVDLSGYYTKSDIDGQRASSAEYRQAAEKTLTAKAVWEAAKFEDTALSGTVNVNMAGALNRKSTISSNVTLGIVSGAKEGQVLLWQLTHSGSNRTLAYNTTYWTTGNSNEGITLSSTSGARDLLMGVVLPDGKIMLSVIARAAP